MLVFKVACIRITLNTCTSLAMPSNKSSVIVLSTKVS